MKLKKDIISHKIARQTVLLDLSRDETDDTMVSTNNTGAFLLELLQQDQTEESLIAALLEKYDVKEEIAKSHVQVFLEGLRELQFLDE